MRKIEMNKEDYTIAGGSLSELRGARRGSDSGAVTITKMRVEKELRLGPLIYCI
jgi:hypothetical protein